MGSWANSVHVRADNPAAVIDTIRAILLESGHRLHTGQGAPVGAASILPFQDTVEEDLTDDHDEDDWEDTRDRFAGRRENVRSIRVNRPCQGWIGILDSEAFSGLGEQLSARLKTDALSVLVNDSDAWYYELRRRGQPFDEFDSSGEDPDGEGEGAFSPELQAAIARGDEATVERLMERELMAHVPTGPIWFPFGGIAPPPELTLLRQRIADGRGGFRDRLRCFWLSVRYRFQVFMALLGWRPMQLGFDIPRVTPLDSATLDRHVARLRDFFPAVDVRALRRLLQLNRFPAEDLLADFFGIIGLPRLYAYLSYNYLEDHGEDELAEEGIVQAAELHFLTPS
jgi:hypothetical protein